MAKVDVGETCPLCGGFWKHGELDLAEDCGELDATATFSGDQVLYYRQSEEAKRCR